MTDVDTTRKNDVEYTPDNDWTDSIPELDMSNRGRKGVYERLVNDVTEAVKKDSKLAKQWKPIARYGNSGSAQGAVMTLRAKYGRTAAEQGYQFVTRRIGDKSAVFVNFNPSAIVEGEKDRAEKQRAIEKAERQEKAAQKKAEAEKGNTEGKTPREQADTPGNGRNPEKEKAMATGK